MAPKRVLAPIVWLVIMMLAGNEAQQQSVKLMTRPSDGAALCALDPPTLSVAMSPKMPGAPEAVRCGMTCTSDGGCKHFNYVSTESNPCQLYHYRPTNFDVSPNCKHYYEPGLQLCHVRIVLNSGNVGSRGQGSISQTTFSQAALSRWQSTTICTTISVSVTSIF